MSHSGASSSVSGMLEEILSFTGRSAGIKAKLMFAILELTQLVDDRRLDLNISEIEAVLPRRDQDGKPFLQINLKQNKKILITDQLIGFKPKEIQGLDLKKLPRVVTTPDLLSVLEALEETLSSPAGIPGEPEILKRAYIAIVSGAEEIGFNMEPERSWILRLTASNHIIAH